MPLGNYGSDGTYRPGGVYKDVGGYQDAYKLLLQKYASPNYAEYNRTRLAEHSDEELNTAGQQFRSYFKNMVGRDPTVDEAQQFYAQHVIPNFTLLEDGRNLELQDATKSFISDNFKQAAQDQVNQELQSQQAEATRLSDVFRQQGREAISGTEQRLMDYQNRLFERLRPQLLVSLQDQGLLNTGGLNEAMAGAQKDLASESANYLSDQYLQNEQAANQIAFGGQSAPYEYQRQMVLNRVGDMAANGESALNRSYQNYSNALAFDRQAKLMGLQAKLARDAQPGLLGRLGQSFVTSFGNSMGQNFSGPAWLSAAQKTQTGGV